jgi:hypothetical protein
MIPRYAYKSFMIKFPHKCDWQNGFNPDNERGLVWYTNRSKTDKCTGAGVYRQGSIKGHSFSLGLHTTGFHLEIYTIKTRHV